MANFSQAQCLTISCPTNITVNNNLGSCGAIVNYTTPVGVDLCSFNSAVEVLFNDTLYYLDGSGGTCAAGYELAPQRILADIATDFIGLNYYSATSNSCCIVHADQATELQDWGFNVGCNAVGPFTSAPALGGAGCTNANLANVNQLTFCKSSTPFVSIGLTTTLTAGIASGGTFPLGTTTVTYTVTDLLNSTSSCSFTVTVVDAENPTISCPGPITINMDAGQCTSTAVIGTATGTDNCAAPTITNNAPASFPTGNTTVTWTSTDAASNFVTCTQIVTVVDAENPTITCPADITVSNDLGTCDAVVVYTSPVGTDNCSGTTTVLTTGPASGATFPIGITTVTYTATDVAGNTTPCSFTVTVNDTLLPTIVCPADITVSNDLGTCDAVVVYTAPVGTDNCSGTTTVLTTGPASGATFPIGITTVTYTATDVAGNTTPCSFTVTVNDTLLPTIVCPDSVITCDSIVTGIAPVSTGDNCVGEYVTYVLSGATTGSGVDDASGTVFSIGITTVQYLVTDSAGNVDSCSFDVQVDNCVGINENTSLNEVTIYPNPTNGLVHVNLGNNNAINYTISTIEGRIVTQESNVTANNMTINLSNESKGIYFLKIENNTSSKVYKIIRK